jgi:sugar/nucleoside kinase (ribokinase family)
MARVGQAAGGVPRPKGFDVVCAGEAQWNVAVPGVVAGALRLRPGGGAVNASLALAREGLQVGLATTLADDSAGRKLRQRIAAAGVDVEGVVLAPEVQPLVVVDGSGAARPLWAADAVPSIQIPEGWSSRVLLLSGLSPVLSYGAAFCKAARAARRAGTTVVVDVNARWHQWAGHDPRIVRTLLHEADVVRCSAHDLAALGVEASDVRAALRPAAVLVLQGAGGDALAAGSFGQVARTAPRRTALRAPGAGDAFTAAICAEVARETPGASLEARGARALERAHDAADARRATRG